MIYVRLLTEQQKDLLVGKQFSSYSYFNPIQDVKGNWIISEEEVDNCDNPDLLWIKELPIIEYLS